MKGPGRPALVALAAILATIAWSTFLLQTRIVPERLVASRPIQVRDDGYVSSSACRACHPNEYATWHGSYHRTMTQVATEDTVIPSFDGIEIGNVYGSVVRLERRGEQFWAEFEDPDWSGAGDRPRITRQIVMITGSHNQQVFWYATGHDRVLGQLPAVYLIDAQRWIPRRAAVLHPPADPVFSETGHWNSTCIACHATHGKPQFDTPFGSAPIDRQTVDTTAAEFGIACEACHGPSDEHARVNRNPLRRYWLHLTAAADPTTVLPTRLDPRRSSQVCGQCHAVWEFYDPRGERQANGGGLPFRPGDDLAATRFVARPTENADASTMQSLLDEDKGFIRDSFWPDGMVRVTGREYNGLVESPCFKNARTADRTLSCFSCHAMHRKPDDGRALTNWADTELTPRMDGNEACLQCHAAMRTNIAAHTKHRVDSDGSSCYNCHMPYTTYGLLKTIRSHQISSPSVAATVETGRPNACNLCHLDKTLAWTSEYLTKWYGTAPTALGDDERSVAASVLWMLRGDAAQRVVVAEAMGSPPAQRASGTGWMPFYLAQLLDDPYSAVRFVAYRSLRTLPGFDAVAYDFVAAPRQRAAAQMRTIDVMRAAWRRDQDRAYGTLLLNPDGTPVADAVLRLLRQRDRRRVLLRE